MKHLLAAVLLFAGLCLGNSHAALAGCTASVSCNNGCFASVQGCPSPYQEWYFSCTAPSQSFSCSGATTCTSTSTYVECDGARQTCSPQQCYQGATFADCGSKHLTCAQCQSHQISCML
jgi:hypothetical protein